MQEGKTKYTIMVETPEYEIHDLIQDFLKKKRFEQHTEDGVTYYQHFDGVWGDRFLEYYIEGTQVIFYVYVGKYKKPKSLESYSVSAGSKEEYKQKLLPLFNALIAMNRGNRQAGQSQPQMEQPVYYSMDAGQPQTYNNGVYANTQPNQYTQSNQFAKDVDKDNGTKAVIGFALSLVGVVLSLRGLQFGLIIIALEFYLAGAGLKSPKKGLAIATFVLAGIQCLLILLNAILNIIMIID